MDFFNCIFTKIHEKNENQLKQFDGQSAEKWVKKGFIARSNKQKRLRSLPFGELKIDIPGKSYYETYSIMFYKNLEMKKKRQMESTPDTMFHYCLLCDSAIDFENEGNLGDCIIC